MNNNFNEQKMNSDDRVKTPLMIIRTSQIQTLNKLPLIDFKRSQSPKSTVKLMNSRIPTVSEKNISSNCNLGSQKFIRQIKTPLKTLPVKFVSRNSKLLDKNNLSTLVKKIQVNSQKIISHKSKSPYKFQKDQVQERKISIVCGNQSIIESEASSIIWDNEEMNLRGVTEKITGMDSINAFYNLFKFRYETYPDQREKLDSENLFKQITKLRAPQRGRFHQKNLNVNIDILDEDFSSNPYFCSDKENNKKNSVKQD